jgi:multidrug efflux pump subunit AcrB
MKLGLSGNVTSFFITSPLTPLLLVASLVLGLAALIALPREEEPQISVPLVDIHILADGLKAVDAAELVTKPLEEIVKGINEVEHVYSSTADDRVVVTARFDVGSDPDDAILRVHEKVRANFDRIPIGIPEPLIVGRGIDDVAILVLTLTPRPSLAPRWDDAALFNVADELLNELAKVEDVGLTYIVGGRPYQIRIEPDPELLSLYGITLKGLVEKVRHANRSFRIGELRERDRALPSLAGQTLQGIADIGQLLLSAADGRPVYVKDVARIAIGGRPDEHRVWSLRPGANGDLEVLPATSIAIAKRKGANAVTVAEEVLERLALVRGRVVPREVEIEVTRNYGDTAAEKADELLSALLMATGTIVLVIALFVGWRAGTAVLVVVPATILLTFLWAWLLGYTINRVSLFALIFAIGILVDDAIVVVDNITRHWGMRDGRNAVTAAIQAVAEVGNPTIIANLTIVAALMPMMFVTGLMGPYMEPIPVNASAAAILSFLLAIVVTPWLLVKLQSLRRGQAAPVPVDDDGGVLGRLYKAVARPLMRGRLRSLLLLLVVAASTLASCALFVTAAVTVKLLPFDNKSEIQLVLDLPESSSLEATERSLFDVAERIATLAELQSVQVYVGTAAPFNFNGLVRHYYLRRSQELGDLQVNLLPKSQRDRASHEIALDIRARLEGLELPEGSNLKVVEVPPGPPVLATLLAEVYGPDARTRRATARKLREIFESVDFIVDVDDSIGQPSERLRFAIDQENLEFHGVEQEAVYDTLTALLGGVSIGYSHRGLGANPVEITVRLPTSQLSLSERLLSTPVPGAEREVELGDVVTLSREAASEPLFRRDGRFIVMVSAELAGRFEAPLYGMLAVEERLKSVDWPDIPAPATRLHGQPRDESGSTLLWDGEWEITYITFRDMGIAFAVAIVAIYLLIVGLFRSFLVPLVVLVPVPLTLIGILGGHWLLGAHFTATSMIGFIALAGIIVRNSILLVDFIRHARSEGTGLRDALLRAGAIRFRPIFLTAFTAQIGAAFILPDPIFQGLAISLIFGLLSSTLLTVLVIPALYVLLRDDGRPLVEAQG